MLYRPNSEFARPAEEFVHEFERREASRKVEMIDYDSQEASHMAELYGIVDQPAILALADDGQVLQMWQGAQLPLMDEVAAYTISGTSFLSPSEMASGQPVSVAAHK